MFNLQSKRRDREQKRTRLQIDRCKMTVLLPTVATRCRLFPDLECLIKRLVVEQEGNLVLLGLCLPLALVAAEADFDAVDLDVLRCVDILARERALDRKSTRLNSS